MIIIHVKGGEHIERALKRFKRKFDRVGTSRRIRAKMAYKKPSIARKEAKLKAIYRQKMHAMEAQR